MRGQTNSQSCFHLKSQVEQLVGNIWRRKLGVGKNQEEKEINGF